MAKRFIDTDIFKKQFIRGLQGSYKLLWLYITTDCNHAGIWECDFEVACLRLGESIDKEKALELFKDKIVVFDKGQKWFIPSFIEFQYGELAENNRAHTGVISVLRKYNLIDKNLKIKPLQSPLQGDKDKDKEQDKDKDKDKDKEAGELQNLIYPFETQRFFEIWAIWLLYRKEKKISYKGIISEQAALKQLSKYNEEFAINLIERSMSNNWQGLIFEKTDQEYEQFRKTGGGGKASRDAISEALTDFGY